MALSTFKTYVANEVLTASDLNSSFSRIHDNALTLISPLTGNLDAGGFGVLNLTHTRYDDQGTAPTTGANEGALYVRDTGGSVLVFRTESDGLTHQLTDSWETVIWGQFFS